jgi:hypothetical protein
MGMYTRFHFAACIVEENASLLSWLEDMCDPTELNASKERFDDHEFFECRGWQSVFWGAAGVGQPTAAPVFNRAEQVWDKSMLAVNSILIHSSLKDYDDECEKFVDWISQYVEGDKGDFLGYSVYEESRAIGMLDSIVEVPKLFYLDHGMGRGPLSVTDQPFEPPF